jgi:hypothetical protein
MEPIFKDDLPKKVVLCLSHEVTSSSSLSKDSIKRIDLACKIFLDNKSDLLITTGWKYKKSMNSTLANMMAVREKFSNIPQSKIIEEINSKDTVGEAVYVRKLLSGINLSSLNIVTSDWHTERAKEIFDFIFWNQNSIIEFNSIKGSKEAKLNEQKNKSIDLFRETFYGIKDKCIEKIYNRMLSHHKLYNS